MSATIRVYSAIVSAIGCYGMRFANTHGDGMVLAAAPQQATVWGFCDLADGQIEVCLDGSSCIDAVITQRQDSSALFMAILPQTKASFVARSILARNSNGATIFLNNVLFGSVWLCSGQSNMDFATPMALNGSDAVQEANDYPNIRVFTVGRAASNALEEEVGNVTQPWATASNLTIGDPTPGPFNFTKWEKHIGQVPGGHGFSAVCWYFGRELYKRLQHPVGLIWSSYGGTPIQNWMPAEARKECNGGGRNGGQFGAMIAPLMRSVISGAVWYQGESNSGSAAAYTCWFPAMIRAWRQQWLNKTLGAAEPEWPFGFVQLSTMGGGVKGYGHPLKNDDGSLGGGYQGVRWAQTAAYGYAPNPQMPNVFMATAADIGQKSSPAGGPHVQDKEDVGIRLALAYRELFLQGEEDQGFFTPGPIADAATWDGQAVLVKFRNLPPNGLQTSLPTSLGVEVSGGDDVWMSATNISICPDRKTVSVALPTNMTSVEVVRYLWASNPCLPEKGSECPLRAAHTYALPALPFVLNVTESHIASVVV